MFNAVNKHPILCIRSMTYRRRGDKHEIKKTEQVLKSKTPDGKPITVNYNVNELDRQMPELLGVSSAVLENVLFCHQEDSLWPFKENTVLKTIFDELFQTTKFSKVQETIKNLTKDKRKKLKDQKHTSDLLKHRYDSLYSDMQKVTTLAEQLTKNSDLLQEKHLEASRIKLDNTVEDEMRIVSSNKGVKEYQLKQFEADKSKLEQAIGLNLEGILIDSGILQKKAADVATLTKELETLKASLAVTTREVEDFKTLVVKCEQSLGEDISEASLESRKRELRTKMESLQAISKDTTSAAPAEDSKPLQRANSGSAVEDVLHQARKVINELIFYIESQEAKLIGIRESIVKSSYEHKRNAELSQQKVASLQKLIDGMNPTEFDNKRGLEIKLEHATSAVEKCKARIAELEGQIDSGFETISLAGQLRSAQTKAASILELRKQERSLSSVMEALQKIISESKLDSKLLSLPVIEMREQYQKQILHSKELLQQRDNEKQVLVDLEKNLFDLLKEINNRETRLKKSQQELAELVGADNAGQASEEGIVEAEKKVRDLEIELATAKSFRLKMMPMLLETSKKTHTCKLCQQDFPEEHHEKAVTSLAKICNPASNQGEKEIEADLEKAKADLAKLKANLSKIEQITMLKLEVATDQEKFNDLNRRATTLRFSNMQNSEDHVKSMESEKYLKELLDLVVERETLLTSLGLTTAEGFTPRHSGRSSAGSRASVIQEQVETQQNADFQDLENKSNEHLMDLLKRAVPDEDHFRKLIDTNRKELKVQELELQKAQEISKQMTEALKPKMVHEFGSASKNHKYAAKSKEELLSEVNDELIAQENRDSQFASDKAHSQQAELALAKDIDVRKNHLRELQYISDKLSEEWTTFQANSTDKKEERARLTDARNYLLTKTEEQGKYMVQITAKEQKLDYEKNFYELLKLKESISKTRMEIEEDNRKIQQLQHKLEMERRSREKYNSLQTDISKMQGIEQTLEVQINQLCSNIHENKHIERDYFESLTEYEYLRDLVTDMEFMSDSVDKALAVHHQEQIELVNKTIASLWKYTYKGDDIKAVEIKTEPLNEPKANSRSSNFNYRVVFRSTDNTELEMRGRSSMGQKVLASVVIRVALAQAFGINCGVLALDEPTTNLDEPNIEGLARFLSDLIDQQSENDSFQLVIITHDDHFIKLFRKYTDTFYLVSKDAEGFSKIEKKDLEKY